MIRKIFIFFLAIIFLYICLLVYRFLPLYLAGRNEPKHFSGSPCQTGEDCPPR
ncbi:MAG: hypothetical protein US68_C0010G0075 [Candidatus Shapirobacteria bacterium GW2011_GWE1_38_10]|uniref:Uncharacterized protein n=1 Tax=Candidatus Shapirobacteria bacterium GW2011_GWE1_38_10 TaxID=1618488 RepID=A0A0G0LB84_9BACT|nr:MAG: hypothetical protein US46_C0013G0030 [Candidatus Shapirobacteria bacterium GW2011_GWF2_37_20]KKQ49941.1 MAG: hypothetical protein US68_C0010G0075 [Candidatus Shapirobacteria bacterium GW2011_GWE1_38_10]KKQ63103.1 MAG: hypothetical protein US85_C0019G0010 [Candidatus Shapirobacteria bacterium GW2011_GWF1_38_23]